MPTHARDRLLQGAEELFYAEGIQAVGVDRILSVTGTGRASFYRHFTGKDALVSAVLERRDEHWTAWLEAAVAEHGGGPLAVFDALAEAAEGDGFHGCAFINAQAEGAEPADAIARIADRHKRRVAGFVGRLLREAGHARHHILAGQFVLLMDGALVTALRERNGEPARRARHIAETLLAGPTATA